MQPGAATATAESTLTLCFKVLHLWKNPSGTCLTTLLAYLPLEAKDRYSIEAVVATMGTDASQGLLQLATAQLQAEEMSGLLLRVRRGQLCGYAGLLCLANATCLLPMSTPSIETLSCQASHIS